jgi:hypothetical protein
LGRGLERVFHLFWRNGFILLNGFMRCIVFDLVLGWKFLGCCFDCCACLIWCWFLNFLVWVLDGPCSDYLESNQATINALSLSLSLCVSGNPCCLSLSSVEPTFSLRKGQSKFHPKWKSPNLSFHLHLPSPPTHGPLPPTVGLSARPKKKKKKKKGFGLLRVAGPPR